MGHLTDDMARLRGEVGALRSAREAFISDLAKDISGIKADVAEMQTGYREDRVEMAGKMKEDLQSHLCM